MLRLRKKKALANSIEAYATCYCPFSIFPCQFPCEPPVPLQSEVSTSMSQATALQLMADIQV